MLQTPMLLKIGTPARLAVLPYPRSLSAWLLKEPRVLGWRSGAKGVGRRLGGSHLYVWGGTAAEWRLGKLPVA